LANRQKSCSAKLGQFFCFIKYKDPFRISACFKKTNYIMYYRCNNKVEMMAHINRQKGHGWLVGSMENLQAG